MNAEDIARFWSHVDVRGPEECWPWKRARTGKGYGRFSAEHRLHTASRVAYEITHGPLGPTEARHTCDNPPCCNPAHLVAGSHAQNMADMAVLAADFGVTPSNVSQIVRRRTWKHLGEAA